MDHPTGMEGAPEDLEEQVAAAEAQPDRFEPEEPLVLEAREGEVAFGSEAETAALLELRELLAKKWPQRPETARNDDAYRIMHSTVK